ncbi:MAG: FixH family protein [Formivibrio sp.]|nr:FixH family protein [Formivibrio sp.]
MKNSDIPSKPWYCYPFVWLLIALPLSAVIASFISFFLAVHTDDGLVADDYYVRGQEINLDIHRDQTARARGISAQILLGDNQRTLRVLLNQPVTGTLQLKFMHPTRAGFDQTAELTPQGAQMWVANLPQPLKQSTWQVELSDTNGQWRLYGEWTIQPDQALILPAKR